MEDSQLLGETELQGHYLFLKNGVFAQICKQVY